VSYRREPVDSSDECSRFDHDQESDLHPVPELTRCSPTEVPGGGRERASRYIVDARQGGSGMKDIVALLSGDDRGKAIPMPDAPAGGIAAQAREWCQTPPDHTALEHLAAMLGAGRLR
jgi:hypothetical protein